MSLDHQQQRQTFFSGVKHNPWVTRRAVDTASGAQCKQLKIMSLYNKTHGLVRLSCRMKRGDLSVQVILASCRPPRVLCGSSVKPQLGSKLRLISELRTKCRWVSTWCRFALT